MFIRSSAAAIGVFGMAVFCLAQDAAEQPAWPEQYVLDYPPAELFCPPIQSTFYEVTRTFGVVGRKRFRQQANGGYGLPIIDKVDGKNLIHVGADLGWHQIGAPVFAVADGIVRMSIGPEQDEPKKPGTRRGNAMAMPWGNLIVVEHKLPGEDGYATTIYGHLDSKRVVKTGDLVKAGQLIGTIGRKNLKINGGYDPHLHFGVRKGRMAEKGMTLLTVGLNGRQHAVTVLEFAEDEVQVDLPDIVPDGLPVLLPGGQFKISKRDDKYFLPASVLWRVSRQDFAIVGYALSTDGWLDPVAFLRQYKADSRPAPYHR